MSRYNPNLPGQETSTPLRRALAEPSVAPLWPHTSEDLEEVTIRRMWAKIDDSPRASMVPPAWSMAVAAAAICLLAFIGLNNTGTPSPLAVEGVNQAEFESSIVAGTAARTLSFDDGSSIELQAEAELSVLNNEGGTFVTKLGKGKAHFHVQPGGPRRWVIEAGDVTVEVIGTRFTVNRSPLGTSVNVDRGIVLVRGEVPGGEMRLTAGQSVNTYSSARLTRKSASTTSPKHETATAVAASASEASDNKPPAPKSPTALRLDQLDEAPGETSGKAPSSTTKTQPAGEQKVFLREIPENTSSQASFPIVGEDAAEKPAKTASKEEHLPTVEELLELADKARRAGDNAQAERLLGGVVKRAGAGDPRRGTAALSLARVSSNPAAIALALETGLPSMPPSLREPALARLVKAYQQMGNLPGARRYARRYLKEFPAGPRAEAVKSWAGLK